MHIEDDPILWNDPLWSALEQAIRAIRKRPNFVLSKPDYVDGLNRTIVNRLAKEAALSDRPVFEVRDDKGKDGRVGTRWLRVNPPGPADAIEVKVWERFCPLPIPQSDIEDVIDHLRAWQKKRAKQLKPGKTKPTGERHRRRKRTEPTEREMQAYKLQVEQRLSGQDLADALGIKSRSAAWRLAKEAKRLINGKKRQSVRAKLRYDETKHRR